MLTSIEQNRIYRNSVSPSRRENLFATYWEYMSLVNILDGIIKEYKLGTAAMLGSKHLSSEDKHNWIVEPASSEEIKDYDNFLNHASIPTQTCFVSLNHTSPRYKDESQGIMSAPDNFTIWSGNQPLPQKVERYVLAYPNDEILGNTRFIIDGKQRFIYEGSFANQKVSEAFSNELFERRFMCILEKLASLPESVEYMTEQEMKHIDIEVFASQEISPIENAILDALSLMAEESNKIFKDLVGKRSGSSYLAQAEKEGLLPSAASMQDYLNIRHLLHHQWDTLDGIGKFNDDEVIKNSSVRRRFLDSYARLCDKDLKDRIQAYIKAADDFRPLVSILNPEFISKDPLESNNKFIKRLQEYIQQNSPNRLFIETRYAQPDKKKVLIKNIQRLLPNINIVDRADVTNLEKIDELMDSYRCRRTFIDIFQQVENRVCQHCLFMGKNYTSVIAWDHFRHQNIISSSEAKTWGEYKKLRNDLSHKYLDKDLNKRVFEMIGKLSEDAFILNQRLDKRTPSFELLDGHIYRARHKNGMVVDIDYSQHKVLNVTYSSGRSTQPVYNSKAGNSKKRPYTEEYPNGVSITMVGTEIIGCRLNNGVKTDIKSKYVQMDDGVKIYYDHPEKIFLVSKTGEKMFADKYFGITNYIRRGMDIALGRKERITMYNGRQLYIGSSGRLENDSWNTLQNHKMQTSYRKVGNALEILYGDNTRIVLDNGKTDIYHNDIKLTYANRKAFAESYNVVPPQKTFYNPFTKGGR